MNILEELDKLPTTPQIFQKFNHHAKTAVGSLVSNAAATRLEHLLSGCDATEGSAIAATASSLGSIYRPQIFTFSPQSSPSRSLPKLFPVNTLVPSQCSRTPTTSTSEAKTSSPSLPYLEQVFPRSTLTKLSSKKTLPKAFTDLNRVFVQEVFPIASKKGNPAQTEVRSCNTLKHKSLDPSRQSSSCFSGSSELKPSEESPILIKDNLLKKVSTRKEHALLRTRLPAWMQWKVSNVRWALRYALGCLFFLAILLCLIVRFLPVQDVSICLFTYRISSSELSIEEVLENIFGHYISRRSLHATF